MLIPFGVLSAAGAGGLVAASDFELIATAFGTGSSGVIEFTSIPTDFKHLQIRSTSRNTGGSSSVDLTFNNVTTTSYSAHYLIGGSTSVTSSWITNESDIFLQTYQAPSVVSDTVAAGVIDILDYTSTSKNTTIRALYGHADNATVRTIRFVSGLFMQTNAINSITFTTVGNFTSTTRFSLYGIKG
jgi:hypothetical protein